jgi:hypothetical protein
VQNIEPEEQDVAGRHYLPNGRGCRNILVEDRAISIAIVSFTASGLEDSSSRISRWNEFDPALRRRHILCPVTTSDVVPGDIETATIAPRDDAYDMQELPTCAP